MRHLKTGRKFGRNSATRSALFKNLSISLIEHEAIKTTLSKAKELRGFLEPLITLSKVDSVSNRRRAFSVRFTGDDARYIKRKGEMSPPFPNINLKNNEILDSETFPILISS